MSEAEGPSIDALLADSDWVRGLARSLVGGARADDVVQDVWLSALERGPRGTGAVRGWLGTLLRNSVRRMHRAEAARAAREAEAARRDETGSTLEVVERFSTQQAVAAAVLELPVAVRDAILLRFYEDLPLREIAARQGISIAGAEKRVNRGLELLRNALEVRLGTRDRHWTVALLPFLGGRKTLLSAKVGAALALVLLVALVVRLVLPSTRAEAVATGAVSGARSESLDSEFVPRASSTGSVAERRSAAPNDTTTALVFEIVPGAVRVRVVEAAGDAATERTNETVVVMLRPAAGFLPAGGARSAACSVRGTVAFEGLAPGPWLAESDRGGSCRLEVEPDAALEVELALPAGPPLHGVVVDADGLGVPDATVWLSPRAAESATPIPSFVDDVAAIRADEHGRFRISSLGAARTIGARASGHAPSADVTLDPWRNAHAELRLVLPGPGARLSGVVRGRSEAPLAGASITIDAAGEGSHELRTRSDERGMFLFDSLLPGLHRLVVCAGGQAPQRERVNLAVGEERELVLTARAGFAVKGRVTDVEGRALAGASIFAARRPWSELPDERFGVRAVSDAAGFYRLAGIEPRAAWIVAEARGLGRIERLVDCDEGGELALDLGLLPPLRLAGRIVDESGRGIGGCAVVVLAPDEWPPRRVEAGADGRFALAVDEDLAHELWIEERGVALARQITVRPQADEVCIRLADAERPCADLVGVLADERGHALDVRGMHVRVIDERGVTRDVATREEGAGRFRAETLFPGVWTVQLLRRGCGPRPLDGAVTLAAFETLDLGVVAAERLDGDRP